MRSIQFKTLASLGILISSAALSIPLMSPSLAAGGGSHGQAQMCAKYKYTALGRDGKVMPAKTGSTSEHCGRTYTKQHQNTGDQQKSQKEACDAAKNEFKGKGIKLIQGETWDRNNTGCNSYQKNRQ